MCGVQYRRVSSLLLTEPYLAYHVILGTSLNKYCARMKAKGGSLVRARKWGSSHSIRPQSPQVPVSTPLRPCSVYPSSCSTTCATPQHITLSKSGAQKFRLSCRQAAEDRRTPTAGTFAISARETLLPDDYSSPTTAKNTALILSSCLMESAGRARAQPIASDSALLAETDNGMRDLAPGTNKRWKNQVSQRTTPPALAAAMTSARGVGGRLGSPLGSPHPAPGMTWAAGRSASVKANAAARSTATLSARGTFSSAPGSKFFPPFVYAGASADPAAGGSPVVLEMVRDAADDEEDTFAGATTDAKGASAGRIAGWQGLTRFR